MTAHGIAGEVRVRPFGSFPERFKPGVEVRISGSDRIVRIERARSKGDEVLLKLSGVDDRDAAMALRGRRLLVAPEDRFPLPDGVYYVDDLRGTQVKTRSGRRIGVVRDILDNPANDIFVVDLDSGEQILIPGVKEFITVNLDSGEVIVDPIPGLLPEAFDDGN